MLLRNDDRIYRVLESDDDNFFIIDCIKRTMPVWEDNLNGFKEITEQELLILTATSIPELTDENMGVVNRRFGMIAPILPVVSNVSERSKAIRAIAVDKGISKQTIRYYLCLFLVYQNKNVLAPKRIIKEIELAQDQKNMRWALNKFYYTEHKNSLKTAYTYLLKEKYCDSYGQLVDEYPTFNQFRYFYRKTRKMQTYYISREGKKDYQRNHRPLLGDGVQQYAKSVGMGMLDSTVCDIYLINSEGALVGRPILTACVDAYSGLCNGYCLSWEGGVYSLRGLMINIVSDKVKLCNKYGITISKDQWDSSELPGTLVTDMGAEYKSFNFEQIAELGVTLINLPPYRPELKGMVEKFFDLIQSSYKPFLKGKGIIEPDYQERGSHDYRKDACLTLTDFEKIILRCIIYYNNSRVIENFPYTQEMLESDVKPYSASIWNWGKRQQGANLIDVTAERIIQVLLPRTTGRFARNGLIVNKLRYKNDSFIEKYLSGGTATIAYDPDNVSYIWLIDSGSYIKFELIESRFENNKLDDVEALKSNCKSIINDCKKDNVQAQIELASFIETIANNATNQGDVNIKGIRKTRQKERDKTHIDYMEVDDENE